MITHIISFQIQYPSTINLSWGEIIAKKWRIMIENLFTIQIDAKAWENIENIVSLVYFYKVNRTIYWNLPEIQRRGPIFHNDCQFYIECKHLGFFDWILEALQDLVWWIV